MQKGVHAKFVDMSTSVREAAVELIGRFVLNKPELIHQYYDMIIERILVSGLLLIIFSLQVQGMVSCTIKLTCILGVLVACSTTCIHSSILLILA